MKPEITQKVKLVHSLIARNVQTSRLSATKTKQRAGSVKIFSLFGNHRRRILAAMLGLAVFIGTITPANHADPFAVAASVPQPTAPTLRAEDRIAHPPSTDRYVDQLRTDMSMMQAQQKPQPFQIAQSIAPSSDPSSIANRNDPDTLQQSSSEASVPIEVGAPKTKTFKFAATAQPYYTPNNTGADGEFANPEDHLPNKTGVTTLVYAWPAAGTLTSKFGRRWGRMHKGIDIAGPIGTPIDAAADGIVIAAGWSSGGYGNLVEIRHSDGTTTRYGHNSRLSVSVGQVVQQGQQVAQMGSTGHSTGSHLHFEIRPSGGAAVNPIAHLPANS
ncbi:MAG: M23 family metallopeptidase [Chamaesiphon sp.]|nr:M23 family metallopeptidase [Chamaesiphon sp.]